MTQLRLILVLIAALAVPAGAQSVNLVVPEIDGLLAADGSGAYQKVLALAAKRARVSYMLDAFPRSRALVGPSYLPVSGNFAIDR